MRDALAAVTNDDAGRAELHDAVREALKGRGAARRQAERTLLAAAQGDAVRLIPLILAVRDVLRREGGPPRGLHGRVDRILRAIAGEQPEPKPPRASRGAGSTPRTDRNAAAHASRRSGKPASRSSQPGDRAGRLLRGLLDLSPDAILTLRSDGRVGTWSRAAAELTGRTRRAVVEVGPGRLFEREEELAEIVGALEAGGSFGPRETRVVRPDGQTVPVRVFGARLGTANSRRRRAHRHLVFLHDLTEVQRIRSRLIETEKLSAMAKIAGSVAHEFRNPLNSLFLSTDLLEDELEGSGAPEEAIAPTLAAIREEIERLNQIIHNYLSLSKVAAHVPEVLDLGAVVTEFVEEWEQSAAERDVELKVRVHDGELAVSADPNQVRRVLVNLVENAFDALEIQGEGGERPRGGGIVTLAVRPLSRSVKLVVKDNGPGIPDDVRERVFEPFFTSKSQGSGLGLYLVREIVLSHGGAITLASTGGRGTSVAMHWPRTAEEAA